MTLPIEHVTSRLLQKVSQLYCYTVLLMTLLCVANLLSPKLFFVIAMSISHYQQFFKEVKMFSNLFTTIFLRFSLVVQWQPKFWFSFSQACIIVVKNSLFRRRFRNVYARELRFKWQNWGMYLYSSLITLTELQYQQFQ
jgi:hypothetical protein